MAKRPKPRQCVESPDTGACGYERQIEMSWTPKRFLWTSVVAALLVVPLAGCGSSSGPAYETVGVGVLHAGSAVPPPVGDVILEIDGKIASKNGPGTSIADRTASKDRSGTLLLDVQTLEQVGLIRYSVDDPWLKRDVSYTGVLLSDLVAMTQPAPAATTLHLVALDDYEVDIALADVERWPIMLATRLDGKPMAVANGGPTRIVFPYGLVTGIDELKYKDLWMWNIKTLTFR